MMKNKGRQCAVIGCENEAKFRGWCRAHYSRFMRHGSPTAGYNSRGVKLDFVQKALKSKTDKCIIFPFVAPSQRYGFVKFNGKSHLVHRVVCRTAHGPQPTPKHEVGHKCGECLCINPRHVRWVTHSRNNLQDKVATGTIMRGERHHKHKIDRNDVWKIRALSKKGTLGVKLAERFGVTPTQITRIVKRKAWSWLGEPPKKAVVS